MSMVESKPRQVTMAGMSAALAAGTARNTEWKETYNTNGNTRRQVMNIEIKLQFAYLLPPPPKVDGGYVFTPVCLSVCLSE